MDNMRIMIWSVFMIVSCLIAVASSKRASSSVVKKPELTGVDVIHYSPGIVIQTIIMQIIILPLTQLNNHNKGVAPGVKTAIIMTTIGLAALVITIKVSWELFVKHHLVQFEESWSHGLWASMVLIVIIVDAVALINLPLRFILMLYAIPSVMIILVGNWDLVNMLMKKLGLGKHDEVNQ